MNDEYYANKLKRLEITLTLLTVHSGEFTTLVRMLLTSPGEFTSDQTLRAFSALQDKQHKEILKAYKVVSKEAPLPEDDDIKAELFNRGILTEKQAQPMEDQNEFGFKALGDLNKESSDIDDLNEYYEDLFEQEDDEEIPF